MAAPHLDLLMPAIEAVRAVLRDLDEDQVPADLRRVATATGGVLPPPMAKAAIRGVERYEWLRDRAAEKLAEGADAADGAGAVSALFLLRPDGWVRELIDRGIRHGEVLGGSAAAGDRRRIDDLEQRLDAARSVSKSRIAALESETRSLRSELEEERSRRRSAQAADARVDAAASRRIAELEDALGSLEGDLRRSAAEVERLAGVERELRRERNTLEAALTEATTGPGWLGADPHVLATHLDELERMARLARGVPAGAVEAVAGPLQLPAGFRPDRHEAIDWLASLERPVTLVVDGYNAGFHLVSNRVPGQARRRLGLELDRLARMAAGPLRIVVVYDSSIDTAPPARGRGGPDIRFTEPGTPADEDIARLAASLGGAVAVLSSDRWVREVVEAAGAIALWSEALVDWAGKR